ncbi:succinate dehydrogenase/fumarate reductase iron-sulfur subunit [Desulfoscipio geothermicus]|uniref:Succinate dehydrogenase / fumarate reductase iron-sulfur subunit n=1 Tax=Desulfoscipio geothermicus DSM 3669 TaxID=1121426 RepID=A0A1I6DYX4_9FIRM|nr:succinate dehydrogenase iron-sulfur subunit [Desulfoscipio geothermicus]SFR10626.1 succinate dehydrogenase / fumarate reductase iron-sulfur subunit [Desulfoscipio geothermicus DSM 3669]
MSSREINAKIFRYDPEVDAEPRFDEFKVPLIDNMAVLDVVMHVQNYIDKTLAFRCSCRIGMCGSCAMYINGKPRLACRTQVKSLGTNNITIMPLPNLPIIRDLATDMEPFFEKWKKIKPYYVGKSELTEPAVIRPDSGEREFIDQMLDCITCGCCYGACSMVATNEDYIGPAALNRAYTLIADKRDAIRIERINVVGRSYGVWRCHDQFNCAEVCPKKLVPTKSIQQLKKRCVLQKFGIFK